MILSTVEKAVDGTYGPWVYIQVVLHTKSLVSVQPHNESFPVFGVKHKNPSQNENINRSM